MTIHKEGYKTIAVCAIVLGILNIFSFYIISPHSATVSWILFVISLIFLLFIISFFRIPKRVLTIREDAVIAPADGKVVVIEEINADEYFTDKRIQVSIFMSPMNVHVNRNPVKAEIGYSQYHKGKYLVAWHPKSSTENERHTIVYRKEGKEVLIKQIAGALAKRIVNYLKVGEKVEQSAEMGFIKFGSRVDVVLPMDAKVQVKIGDNVQGGVTIVALW